MRIVILLCLTFLLSFSVQSQMPVTKAQATYIAYYTQYVQWPDGDLSDGFTIGIAGSDELQKELEVLLNGRKINDRLILIKKVTVVGEIEKCNILFVSFDKNNILADAIKLSAKNNILLITERAGAIERGALINFVVINNLLKYQLNEAIVAKTKLNVNPILYKMAVMP